MNDLRLIGRSENLFSEDVELHGEQLNQFVAEGSFLVIGGAGSIGQAVVKEIFSRSPRVLHVVDISENNLVEMVRDIRSTYGYIKGDFQTFCIDCGSIEFYALMNSNVKYDYVLNLSALKHVRSERDPYTLMRLIQVNIVNTIETIKLSQANGVAKYFCVSTDKATNPVNMMGASKRIMEMFLMRYSADIPISTARFANVAFSDGSLLHGFRQRILKRQPISAPHDVKRYFLTSKESGQLCLMSCIFGENRDIFYPKLNENFDLTTFSDIAVRYLRNAGFEAVQCASEDEARNCADELISKKKWPCYFFKSETTGEKDFEEFFSYNEILDVHSFKTIGVIKNNPINDDAKLQHFLRSIELIKQKKQWSKSSFIDLFAYMLPNFSHKETGKYLDQRM